MYITIHREHFLAKLFIIFLPRSAPATLSLGPTTSGS